MSVLGLLPLLSLLGCETCPTGETCQAPCPTCPTGAVDLAGVNTYVKDSFYSTDAGGWGAPISTGVTELHDGMYGVVARRTDNQYAAPGLLIARDGTPGAPGWIAPTTGNEETFCASRGFSWPQFLAGGTNPPMVTWTIVPYADIEPQQAACNGIPFRMDHTFDPANGNAEYPLDSSPTKAGVKRFHVRQCVTATGQPNTCPPLNAGVPDTSGTRATTLRPGVYVIESQGLLEPLTPGPDTYVTGSATVFVRAASDATKPWAVETYCYSDTFRWPRVKTTAIPGGLTGAAFWDTEFTVAPKVDGSGNPETAPATVASCPAGQPVRMDYCFSTDPAVPCPN